MKYKSDFLARQTIKTIDKNGNNTLLQEQSLLPICSHFL